MTNRCTDCALGELSSKKGNCISARRMDRASHDVWLGGLRNSKNIDFLFVGEAPGYQEDKQGLPFVGAAGKRLDAILSLVLEDKHDTSRMAITNLVRCSPPKNRKPYIKEVRACQHYLEEEIAWIKPKVVICLGAVAWKALGDGSTLGKARLRYVDTEICGHSCRVTATFHPAATLHDPSRVVELAEDLDSILTQAPKKKKIRWKSHQVSLEDIELERFQKAKTIVLDIETKSLNIKDELILWAYQLPPRKMVYVVEGSDIWFQYQLRMKLLDPTVTMLGHNTKFDISRLCHKFGIVPQCKVEDTMAYDFMRMEDSWGRSLQRLSALRTSLVDFKETTEKAWREDAPVTLRELRKRCAYDVAATSLIKRDIVNDLSKAGDYYPTMHELYRRLNCWVSHLEAVGIAVDPKERDNQYEEGINNRETLLSSLYSIAPDTLPTSTKQLRELLFLTWGLPVQKEVKSGPSTDAETIGALIEPLAARQAQIGGTTQFWHKELDYLQKLIKLRTQNKILTTFIKHVPEGVKFVYPTYYHVRSEMGGTGTGRLSAKDPAIQTYPKGPIRKMFNSRWSNGSLWCIDGSQMELRIAADLAGDPVLLDLFHQDVDLHQATADMCSISRQEGKTVNFLMIYGGTVEKLVEGGLSLEVAKRAHGTISERWHRLFEYQEEVRRRVVKNKRAQTPYGAIRRLPLANFATPQGQEALRQGVNHEIQNPASHLVQLLGWQLLECSSYDKFLPIMTHHDGLVFDCKHGGLRRLEKALKDWREVCKEVLDWMPSVPFVFEITKGPNWYNQKFVRSIKV